LTSREPSPRIITLTTDFGLRDPYVASMKAVILSMEREVLLVDISHELPPHKILPAALLLREVCPRFPPGTIHVAVVDPGVGGARRPILVKIQEHFLIGPDNGLFGLLIRDFGFEGAWRIENSRYILPSVSRTFHGRDLFAPVAAHLAGGIRAEDFGPEIRDLQAIDLPSPKKEGGRLNGEILWIDHFGNCMTNISEEEALQWSGGEPFAVRVASRVMDGVCSSFDSVPLGECLAVFNSMRRLEIACNQSRADQTLGLDPGDPVVLEKA